MAFEIELPVADDPAAESLAARLAEVGNERFLRAVLPGEVRFHHRSTDRLLDVPEDHPDGGASLLLRALHLGFTAHLPLSLSPDVLWYAVVHEVAVHIRLNAEQYAGLFTETPGHQQTIPVRDDSLLFEHPDWQRAIGLFQAPLRAKIGDEVADLFQPAFSTTTPVDATAALVALMDVVSPYYRYRLLSLCGIPRIRLEGTAADWRVLAARARELAGWFDGLRPWFAELNRILRTIAETAGGAPVDQEFWGSLYKWRSHSGGDSVTGWINAFLAHRHTDEGPQPKRSFAWRTDACPTDEFPAHVSQVPLRWTRPDGTVDLLFAGGVLGIERDGSWVRPRLGVAVAERTPARQPVPGTLPEDWTLADIRRVSDCADAELLPTTGRVVLLGHGPERELLAETVLRLDSVCLVRAEGRWFAGDLVSDAGDVHCWAYAGPDLGTALRF